MKRFNALKAVFALGSVLMTMGILRADPLPQPELPQAPADIEIQAGKSGKPSAGDVIMLTVHSPDAMDKAEPAAAEQLKNGPVEHGDGRILWWKRSEQKPSDIILGLTTYKPGRYSIPSLVFNNASQPSFKSAPQAVEFAAIGGDKSKDDIYPPEDAGMPRWFWVLMGLLALGAVLGAIYGFSRWYASRRSKMAALRAAPRLLNPQEEFDAAKSALLAKGFLEKENYKPHYFGLSDAAKKFLGRAYRCEAEERTTRELAIELSAAGMAAETVSQWSAIFEEMDVVKFTDQAPAREVAQSIAERLSKLVTASYRMSPVAREALLQEKPVGEPR